MVVMNNEILQMLTPSSLPFGFFDKKGKFISVRKEYRKFRKILKERSGVNPVLLGLIETIGEKHEKV